MKVPFSYQISDYDSGPVCFRNALSYLYEREEMNPEFIHYISDSTMDALGRDGKMGGNGTTREAFQDICQWIMNYQTRAHSDLAAIYLEKEQVDFDRMRQVVENGGVAIIRVYLRNQEHHILVTGFDQDYVYFFDPYYLEKEGNDIDSGVEIHLDHAFSYNRKVSLTRFLSPFPQDYALLDKTHRECILLNRK